MREEVEALEDDADVAAQLVDVDADVGDAVAVDRIDAAVDGLEHVDAAQQRGLAEPDAPMRHTTSCSSTVMSMPRSTQLSPNRFSTLLDLEERRSSVRPHLLLVAADEVVGHDGAAGW